MKTTTDIASNFSGGLRPIWVASYPRSGNTFLLILLENFFGLPAYSIYNLAGSPKPDPSARHTEASPLLPTDWRKFITKDSNISPALVKTHDLPEDDSPAIYIVRDGRPAINSYFHFNQTFEPTSALTLTETIAGGGFGSWSAHYRGWQPQQRPRTLFLRYEDLVLRPEAVIPRLAEFLQREPMGGRVPTFAELRAKDPKFFRRGQNQDFLNEWSPTQISLFNTLHGEVMTELGYPLTDAPLPDKNQLATLTGDTSRRLTFWRKLRRAAGLVTVL